MTPQVEVDRPAAAASRAPERGFAAATLAIFFLVLGLAYVLHGHQAVLTNDEGILLEPAQRIAAGERPYTDFFAYMSPGSYWIQALAFRMLGLSILASRLPVMLDFATQCALVYWLVRRYASARSAGLIVFLFFCFQSADPEMLTAQHRWDSSTLALLSVALILRAVESERWASQAASCAAGALAAYAALCTPSVGLVGLVTILWMVRSNERRRALLPYAAGIGMAGGIAAAYLLASGMFWPFLAQLLWLRRNYSSVNVMPYGSINGGYAALFEGSPSGQMAIEAVLVVFLALPALLPVAAAVGWGWSLARRGVARAPEMLYLLGVMGALVASAFPRADVVHLAFVAAPAYVLAAIWISRNLSLQASLRVGFLPVIVALLFLAQSVSVRFRGSDVASPVGSLHAPSDAEGLADLFATVRSGDSLYVHPYMPVLYFWTQARNPTRYADLAPGMMTGEDEARVLEDLTRRPPEWVMYLPLTEEGFLRLFSSGRAIEHKFPRVEAWIREGYQAQQPAVTVGGYQLMRRK